MMNNLLFRLNQSSQALSILLGSIIILLIFYVSISDFEPFYIYNWITTVLGYTFLSIILFLTLFSIVCILNICNTKQGEKKFWFETGCQLSNLISSCLIISSCFKIFIASGFSLFFFKFANFFKSNIY